MSLSDVLNIPGHKPEPNGVNPPRRHGLTPPITNTVHADDGASRRRLQTGLARVVTNNARGRRPSGIAQAPEHPALIALTTRASAETLFENLRRARSNAGIPLGRGIYLTRAGLREKYRLAARQLEHGPDATIAFDVGFRPIRDPSPELLLEIEDALESAVLDLACGRLPAQEYAAISLADRILSAKRFLMS
ncbi:MAG: hypothetical protein U1E65_15690 [Myxococcota bacterium]